MRSAQRKERLIKHNNKRRTYGLIIKLVIPVVGILFALIFINSTIKNWDGKSKLSFVYQNPSGDAGVTILDPVLSEETTLIIPGETEVDVAHNFGTLRLKNVWQFGVNEKLGGELLAQTITNNFYFPTYLWAKNSIRDPWKFVFYPGPTNIPFGDRFMMAFFSVRVRSIDKTVIDLGKNQFLTKQLLTDGSSGYVISGPISGRLTVYFADNEFSDKNLKFEIIDATNTPGLANKVGAIMEVLGGKVVSVDKTQLEADFDCEVSGHNAAAVRTIAALFSCRKTGTQTNFDLSLHLGGKFAKRY